MRSSDRAAEARRQGADEIAIGDLNDSESLRRATKGVDGVFHINPAFAPNEADFGVAMVRAAVSSGVRKFTFSGVIYPSISTMSNHAAKLPVEGALYESGLVFTVLQPAMFMQTLVNSWKEVLQKSSFSLPYSRKAKACYVDYRDVAEAAAICAHQQQAGLRHIRAFLTGHVRSHRTDTDDVRCAGTHDPARRTDI